MLIINNDIVSQILVMGEVIGAQDAAFKKLPTGGAIRRPRVDLYYPCKRDDGYFRCGTMAGANDGYCAINKPLIGDVETNALTFVTRRRI